MRSLLSILLLILFFNLANAQQRGQYIDFDYLESVTAETMDSLVQQETGFPGSFLGIEYDIDVYFVSYYTQDFHPDSLTIATSLVCIPTNYPCNELGIVTFGHGLCLKDREAPSNNDNIYSFLAKGYACNGLIAAAPDYIHLGPNASPGFQGFVHEETEATATVDLFRAIRNYAADNSIELSGQIFLSGYSQGGHSSLATAKMMQEELSSEFTVTGCASGGGTYDLSGIAADSLLSPTRKTPERQSLALVVRSYIEAYNDSLPFYGLPSDPEAAMDSIFEHPYDSILNIMLLRDTPLYNNSLLDSIPSRMLSDSFEIKARTEPDFFFRRWLSYNDLYDWVPQMPLMLFQSTADIEDPIANTIFTLQQFEDNGAPDVQFITVDDMSHPDAALPYALYTQTFMVQRRVDCLTGVEEERLMGNWSAYPNPATSTLNLSLSLGSVSNGTKASLINLQGQVLLEQTLSSVNEQLKVDMLPRGTYLLQINDPKLKMTNSRLVVLQ